MTIRARNGLIIITMALFILCSGSQFGIDNARYMDILFFGVALVSCLMSGKTLLRRNNILSLLVFLGLMWVNFVLFIRQNPNMNAYISYSLRIVGTLLVCSNITGEEFEKHFSNLILAICLISFIPYLKRIANPGYYGYEIWMTLFRTSNVSGTIRNAGIFWEPGAFQVFINLALFFTLKKENFLLSIKRKWTLITIAIYVIAIITTTSTTGYLLFMVNIITVYFASFRNMSGKRKVVLGVPMLVAVIYVLVMLFRTDIVVGKFIGGGNVASTNIRMNDLIGTLQIIAGNPFGLGHGTETYFNTLSSFGIGNNSTGLLTAVCNFGWLFAAFYLVKVFMYSRSQVRNKWVTYLIIVVLAGFTENFYYYPVYMVMLYEFNETRKGEVKHEQDDKNFCRDSLF